MFYYGFIGAVKFQAVHSRSHHRNSKKCFKSFNFNFVNKIELHHYKLT